MKPHESKVVSARRSFLQASFPGVALLRLGWRCCLHAMEFPENAKPGAKHKFLEDSGMSFTEVFKFAYESWPPLLRGLERELGT